SRRPQADAARRAAGDVGRVPLAHLRVRWREQLVDRGAERIGHFNQDGKRRIAFTGLEVGDGRARYAGRLGERLLRQRAGTAKADEVAREMRGGVLWSVHRFDFPPIDWTTRFRRVAEIA